MFFALLAKLRRRRLVAARIPTEMPVVRPVLLAAADYLATYGWTQRAYLERNLRPGVEDPNPPACLLGAIWTVTHPGQLIVDVAALVDIPAVHVLAAHLLGTDTPAPLTAVTGWNDKPHRTAHEAIEVLRAAAHSAH